MQARDGGIRAGVKIGMSWGVLNFIFASLYAVTLYVGGHGLLTGATNKQGGDVVTVLIALITGMGGVNSFSGYLPTMTKALASAAALRLGRAGLRPRRPYSLHFGTHQDCYTFWKRAAKASRGL